MAPTPASEGKATNGGSTEPLQQHNASPPARRQQTPAKATQNDSPFLVPTIIGMVVLILALAISNPFSPPRDLSTNPNFTDPNCNPSTFTQMFSEDPVFGTALINIAAHPYKNYTQPTHPFMRNSRTPFSTSTSNLTFCEVLITYTHLNYHNLINVTTWLPTPETWNGRFQGTGGGGYAAGLGGIALAAPVARGFAASATDAGLPGGPGGALEQWALRSEGNVDFRALRNFGYRAVGDTTVFGKRVVERYYGRGIEWSYWNGCSTGGRQGLDVAQRYPGLYDGVLATAPAVGWPGLIVSTYWPQLVMQMLCKWPQGCELRYITEKAVEKCDELDGTRDGIVGFPDLCEFDPMGSVGVKIACPNEKDEKATIEISEAAARVAVETWKGARSPTGDMLWSGLSHESALENQARTKCDYEVDPPVCSGMPLADDYIQLLLYQKSMPKERFPSGSFLNITWEEYTRLFHLSRKLYDEFLGSNDADLSEFAKGGGKMITWHGLADEIIPTKGSRAYFESVLKHYEGHSGSYSRDRASAGTTAAESEARLLEGTPQPSLAHEETLAGVSSFYRYYEAPGVAHCLGGPGALPGICWDSAGALDQLMAWVENGTEPEALHGVMKSKNGGEGWARRPICLWPKFAVYRGEKGREAEGEGWVCEHQKKPDSAR